MHVWLGVVVDSDVWRESVSSPACTRVHRTSMGLSVLCPVFACRQPDKLYEGGLQRTLFLPFIKELKARV